VGRDLAFDEAEYRQRVRRTRAAMAVLELDALLCHTFANVCYLTGFETIGFAKYTLAVVPAAGEPVLLCEAFEAPNAAVTSWVEDVVTYPTYGDPLAATVDLLRARGLGAARLGLDGRSTGLSGDQHARLMGLLPSARWLEAAGTVERVKAVKSPAEIDYLRRAGRLSTLGMEAALAAVAAGATDNDVALAAYAAMIGGGSEYMCYAPIVTVGARSGVPHTSHRRVAIGPGDALLLEFGACLGRYSAPTMRPATVGRPSAAVRRAAEACRDAVERTLAGLRPGAAAADVAARAAGALVGLPPGLVWHGRHAYAIGLGFPPTWADGGRGISLESDLVLEEGMAFHVTTSLRDVGRWGVAFGDTAVVTADGCEVMTRAPRELLVKE
jgi:Xaa-Pro aminopeptidase